jgi:mono/diheme cytochrome c family protein
VYSEAKTPTGTTTGNTNGIYQMRMLLGTAPLAADGSVRAQLPASTGVVLELQDANHAPIVTMGEEHQLGPGEQMSMGVGQPLFNAVCGGCHGSVSGIELDIAVTPDALTGASASMSATASPTSIGN